MLWPYLPIQPFITHQVDFFFFFLNPSGFKDGSVYLGQIFLLKDTLGTSQVVQRLRLLLLQGARVQLLVRELRSSILRGAAQN